jgi:flavin-binding protein dodecin
MVPAGSKPAARARPRSRPNAREKSMSVVKVIEVLAQSDKSWEDAAKNAVKVASKSVKNIKSIYIEHFEAKVDNGKIIKYRINGKLTFALMGTEKI